MRKRLREILHDNDYLHSAGFAFASMGLLHAVNIAYIGITPLVNFLSGSNFEPLDLNAFKTIGHFGIGFFAGAFTYRRMGGGIKGAAYGLVATTGFNVAWEGIEPFIKSYNGESFLDTATDIASVYAGGISSFLLERYKSNLNSDLEQDKYGQ